MAVNVFNRQAGNNAGPRTINAKSRFSPASSRESSPFKPTNTLKAVAVDDVSTQHTNFLGRGRGVLGIPRTTATTQPVVGPPLQRSVMPGIGRGMFRPTPGNTLLL